MISLHAAGFEYVKAIVLTFKIRAALNMYFKLFL